MEFCLSSGMSHQFLLGGSKSIGVILPAYIGSVSRWPKWLTCRQRAT